MSNEIIIAVICVVAIAGIVGAYFFGKSRQEPVSRLIQHMRPEDKLPAFIFVILEVVLLALAVTGDLTLKIIAISLMFILAALCLVLYFKVLNKSTIDTPSSGGGQPPPLDPIATAVVTRVERADYTQIVDVIEQASLSPDALWGIATQVAKKQDFKGARAILDTALNRYSDNPKLLITSGAVWSKLGQPNNAISDYEKAIRSAKDNAEFEEQYYVANSNLCYRLAYLKDGKIKALEAGKLANDNADRFPNRNSFKINYGYARLQFAENDLESARGLVHLLQLYESPLSEEHRQEINRYVTEGVSKLCHIR